MAQRVWHREWHEDREHEPHREMLTRVKEFDGDVDKLLVEYQQDIDIESGQPGELNQELKDCVDEPRRVSQRVPRQYRSECGFEFKCVFGSRFEYGFEYGFENGFGCRFEYFEYVNKCVVMQSENVVTWF